MNERGDGNTVALCKQQSHIEYKILARYSQGTGPVGRHQAPWSDRLRCCVPAVPGHSGIVAVRGWQGGCWCVSGAVGGEVGCRPVQPTPRAPDSGLRPPHRDNAGRRAKRARASMRASARASRCRDRSRRGRWHRDAGTGCSLSTIIFLQAVAATPCTASQTPVLRNISQYGKLLNCDPAPFWPWRTEDSTYSGIHMTPHHSPIVCRIDYQRTIAQRGSSRATAPGRAPRGHHFLRPGL
eukprot:COSAG01_NODE_6028_length_3891_cov_2.424842_5_plen_239_part_00